MTKVPKAAQLESRAGVWVGQPDSASQHPPRAPEPPGAGCVGPAGPGCAAPSDTGRDGLPPCLPSVRSRPCLLPLLISPGLIITLAGCRYKFIIFNFLICQ